VLDSVRIEEAQYLIDQLPEGYKMVFVMYEIEGYRHKEIAELLSIKESTSKSQLFKARKYIAEAINSKKTANGKSK
jgi:RNA polymerase sigma-70 factor (ECF subfamily)